MSQERPDESALRREIAALDATLRAHLSAAGFDTERLVAQASTLVGSPEQAAARRDAKNRVRGHVRAPTPDELPKAPVFGSEEHARLTKVGLESIAKGELAFCVMAGGMATRMGGVVKALVEAAWAKTFLELRLKENATWSSRAGCPVPLWLMTSEATDEKIRAALKEHGAPPHVRTFMQDIGLRLTPNGHLFREGDGAPSTYATGHGDLPDAVRRAELAKEHLARGGKYVWIANLDNLGATLDPAILGHFIEASRDVKCDVRCDVMVEVCEKAPGDRGGIPVWAGEGDACKLQVLEEFRLPTGFDASAVRVFNTNTFLVTARALESAPVAWTYFEVEKKVFGRAAIQYERLLQELTANLRSAYVVVPREGEASRFLPVKDNDELARRRASIEAVAQARGMV